MLLMEIAGENGLNAEEREIFREYTANRFAGAEEIEEPDVSFLKMWERIVGYAGMFGADQAVNKMICPGRPVTFNSPETAEIRICDSFAGKIPVIYVRDTADFENVVTNVAYKGVRPDNLSETGASFLSNKSDPLHHSFRQALQQRAGRGAGPSRRRGMGGKITAASAGA